MPFYVKTDTRGISRASQFLSLRTVTKLPTCRTITAVQTAHISSLPRPLPFYCLFVCLSLLAAVLVRLLGIYALPPGTVCPMSWHRLPPSDVFIDIHQRLFFLDPTNNLLLEENLPCLPHSLLGSLTETLSFNLPGSSVGGVEFSVSALAESVI